MNILKNITYCILIILLTISCVKENEPTEFEAQKNLLAKWVVNNSNDYVSFEFNKSGNYLVVKKVNKGSKSENKVLFGAYKVIKENVLKLSDIGTISITNYDNNTSDFLIEELNTQKPILINLTKEKEKFTSTKSDLLCRTWEMVTFNDEDAKGTILDLTVLFTKAGTYFVTFSDPMLRDSLHTSWWMWKDETENILQYSHYEKPVWSKESEVSITKLTNENLTIIERDMVFKLRPYTPNYGVITSNKKAVFTNKFDLKKSMFKN